MRRVLLPPSKPFRSQLRCLRGSFEAFTAMDQDTRRNVKVSCFMSNVEQLFLSIIVDHLIALET